MWKEKPTLSFSDWVSPSLLVCALGARMTEGCLFWWFICVEGTLRVVQGRNLFGGHQKLFSNCRTWRSRAFRFISDGNLLPAFRPAARNTFQTGWFFFWPTGHRDSARVWYIWFFSEILITSQIFTIKNEQISENSQSLMNKWLNPIGNLCETRIGEATRRALRASTL